MANKFELRKINRSQIFSFLFRKEEASKQDIALATGLSVPTVAKILEDLETKGVVDKGGSYESTGGRKAQIIRCCYDAKYAIGVDITKHHLTMVIVNLKGEIIGGGKRELFLYFDTQEYYDAFAARLFDLLNQHQITQDKILGVGISLPAIIDQERNLLTYSRILDAPEDMIHEFQRRFPFPVAFFNDANSAGYAETWLQDFGTVFYLMLSNSVGGAFIDKNKMYMGDNNRSAEVGHMRIIPNGRKCYCGQRGCVNAYCSSKILSDMAGGNLNQFFEEVKNGNSKFQEALDMYLRYLAITIVNLKMLLDCPIILGGYAGIHLAPYIKKLQKIVLEMDPYENDGNFVRLCSYTKTAAAAGAAMYFLNSYIESL